MAWHHYLLIGVSASALALACTVKEGDGDENDHLTGGGDGGELTSGGSSNGGGGTSSGGGGASNGGGGSSNGGTPSGGAGGGASVCEADTDDSDCLACIKSKCCEDWEFCVEDDACIGPGGDDGELQCIQDCMYNIGADAGAVTNDDLLACANACPENGPPPSVNTDELLSCINTVGDAGDSNCGNICFGL